MIGQMQEKLNETLMEEQQTNTSSTTTTSTICPATVNRDRFEQIKTEIIDTILQAISRNVTSVLQTLQARMLTSPYLNGKTTDTTKLTWKIYTDLEIPLQDWTLVFDQPYSHVTRSGDLVRVANLCPNQSIVAASINGSISLAAVGPASILITNTMWNRPRRFGQVFWYRTPEKSFGFSPLSIIRQTSGDNEDLGSPLRLSWLLDQNVGGYRAGATRKLENSSLWHKVIYCD